MDGCFDQDIATFGDVLGHPLALLAKDDHGEVGGLVFAVTDTDIERGESSLPLRLPRLVVRGRVADDQFLVIHSGPPTLNLTSNLYLPGSCK